jgi:hypothetical protein
MREEPVIRISQTELDALRPRVIDFAAQHPAGFGVVLADGSYSCHDCLSLRGEHRCHGSDGTWNGAPTCTCPWCSGAQPKASSVASDSDGTGENGSSNG